MYGVNLPLVDSNCFIWVTDWVVGDDDISLYAIGVTKESKRVKMKIKKATPGLYIWTKNSAMLECIINLPEVDIKNEWRRVSPDTFNSNSTNVGSELITVDFLTDKWICYFIPTKTFSGATRLYKWISSNHLNCIKCTTIWNLGLYVYMRLYDDTKSWSNNIYNVFINGELETGSNDAFKINTCVFDFETVSHLDHRIPMGNFALDILFSASFCLNEKRLMYIYLPNQTRYTNEIEEYLNQSRSKNIEVVVFYKNEAEILNAICDVLYDPFKGQFFFLMGYNSRNYDLKFLLKRLVYKNMMRVARKFCIRDDMITYGPYSIHVDLFCFCDKFMRGKIHDGLKLKNVMVALLPQSKMRKIDMDARLLRYPFMEMLAGVKWNEVKSELDLNKLTEYNIVDSELALELWTSLQIYEFLTSISGVFKMSLVRCLLSGMTEYLTTKFIIDGLCKYTLLTSVPTNSIVYSQECNYAIDAASLSNTSVKKTGDSYGGGFNYKWKRELYDRVTMMDMVTYYPNLIVGFNLSHETCAIYPVSFILDQLAQSKDAQCVVDAKQVIFYRYSSHRNINKIPTKPIDDNVMQSIIGYKLMGNTIDNASKVEYSDLKKMDRNDVVAVISLKKNGFLSTMMKDRNTLRDIAKSNKKNLSNVIASVADVTSALAVAEFKNKFKLDDDEDDDDEDEDEDEDDDEEDEDGGGNKIDETDKTSWTINVTHNNEFDLVKLCIKLKTLAELKKMTIVTLGEYKTALDVEFSRINAIYENLKIVNNSVYGICGSMYAQVKSRNVAAISTLLGRKFIIELAKIGGSYNCSTILSDTDSIFFTGNPNAAKSISRDISNINPYLDVNAKTYTNVFIMAKKVYFANHSESIMTRGITKNGPILWTDVLDSVCKLLSKETSMSTARVYQELEHIYQTVYDSLNEDPTRCLISCNIKANIEDYATNTQFKRLMERTIHQHPGYVFGRKLSYFHVRGNTAKESNIDLDINLESMQTWNFNLFKFLNKIAVPMYKIFSQMVYVYNKERNFFYTLSYKTFEKMSIKAYESVIYRNKLFDEFKDDIQSSEATLKRPSTETTSIVQSKKVRV